MSMSKDKRAKPTTPKKEDKAFIKLILRKLEQWDREDEAMWDQIQSNACDYHPKS